MLVLSQSDVESLLDLDALVDVLAAAMVDLSAGRASMPPRVAAAVDEGTGLLAAMPAFLPSSDALVTKLVSLFPHNTDRPTHQAVICCFDTLHGSPVALMDGTVVTAARTAAGSVLATRLLARDDSAIVAIVGTGVQARSHARAMARLPGVASVRIAARNSVKLRAMADELRRDGIRAEEAPSIEHAVRSADIVCTTTHAHQPVVLRDWLQPGTHVNSVGYNTEGEGEIDGETLRDALVVVESRDSALAPPPAGAIELRLAIERGFVTPDEIGVEIGELVAGSRTGRTADEQITVYKSVGVAVQDAAAAALILRAAQERDVGTEVPL